MLGAAGNLLCSYPCDIPEHKRIILNTSAAAKQHLNDQFRDSEESKTANEVQKTEAALEDLFANSKLIERIGNLSERDAVRDGVTVKSFFSFPGRGCVSLRNLKYLKAIYPVEQTELLPQITCYQ